MKRPRLPAVLLALALAAGFTSGCEPKGPHRVLARALLVKGAVQMVSPLGGARALAPAEALEAGSRLSVPAGASAAISFVPGIAALADEQTELVLDSLEMEKTGLAVEARRARVTLRAGTARFLVGSPLDRRLDLEVRAPGSVTLLAVPGSLFSVVVRPAPGGVRVTCAQGAVGRFSGGALPGSWIVAGNFQEVNAETSSEPPRPVFDDSAARREAADLFDAAAVLGVLQTRQRDLIPFRP